VITVPVGTSLRAAIADQLAAAADEKTRVWWERYLKGAVPFRGVPMAGIRRIVHETWRTTGVDQEDPDVQIELALGQFAEPYSEDKIAGVLALSELLLDHVTVDHVPALAGPFERGHIEDWSTCDWYCVKVLGRFVERGADRQARAEAIGAWRDAQTLWQRRAAAVSFVNLAPQGERFYDGFTDLLLTVCRANVADPARFSQTSVGWLLRELSGADPDQVRAFLDEHGQSMCREARRAAAARLPVRPLAVDAVSASRDRFPWQEKSERLTWRAGRDSNLQPSDP
jgi:3-methyladenine DNA glycosylase AlkD